ncbi:tyrosine-type recombinase/integrase [Nocardioides lianchengensis]|uniref:Site-specific recombinase XerD n=1 Tax=Nocardioides lianchengensis TaxID=1045774 RepID=A0A1G7C0R1_9ACTN|nr:Site-specific recombinase XerD [Nocardioides lianchengensis]
MASYSVAKRPNGRWRARFRGPDGRERSRHFDRKVDADRWARTQVGRIDRGEWTDPSRGRITIGEYAPEWLATKVRIRPSTRLMYDVLIRNQILPTWEKTRLDAVRYEDVSVWVAKLHDGGLSAARTRHAWIVLSQILDLAVRAKRIPNNQAKGVELPALPSKSERDKVRFLDEREVWHLAEAAGDGALTILVLAWCGLRFGELAALRCGSLDPVKRELRITWTLSETGGKQIEGPPKTESSIRTVPLPAWLCDRLMALTTGRQAVDYLFTAARGGPIRTGNWRTRVFDPAVKRSGLASQVKGDMLRPHDLRHTCASLHIKHGTPPKVLSEMLGHASVAITLDRYGHLYPGDVHLYVDRLGEVALAARADFLRTSGTSGTPEGAGRALEIASDLRKQVLGAVAQSVRAEDS